jgi:hypothetical protein
LDEQNDAEVRKQSKVAADFTVVFLDLRENSNVCLGSGTLVKYGEVFGVVTCAHVLQQLSRHPKFGISSQTQNSNNSTFPLEVLHDETIVFGGNGAGPDGPDLGFLRLSETAKGHLAARSSFLNGDFHSHEAGDGDAQSDHPIDFLVGSVEELNNKSPHLDGRRVFTVTTVLNAGAVTSISKTDQFDILTFTPNPPYPSLKLPESYEGLSGGGLWRFHFQKSQDDHLEFTEWRFAGVAFYQTEEPRRIICHGPKSVHKILRDAVMAKWPSH